MAQSHTGCTLCGYDLAGNVTGVCPECGRPVIRFTDRARAAMVEANRQAVVLYSKGDPLLREARWWLPRSVEESAIWPRHVLLGILKGPHGVGHHALLSCGAEPVRLRDAVVSRMPRFARRSFPEDTRLPLSPTSVRIIEAAIDDAFRLGHQWVGTEHLLLALCKQSADIAVRTTLTEAGVGYDRVRAIVIENMAAVNVRKSEA